MLAGQFRSHTHPRAIIGEKIGWGQIFELWNIGRLRHYVSRKNCKILVAYGFKYREKLVAYGFMYRENKIK